MFQLPSLPVYAVLLFLGSALSQPSMAEVPASLEQCIDLYRLWLRYESHSTFHSSQKARANIALECECTSGRYAIGVEELKKMLRRGLVPIPH